MPESSNTEDSERITQLEAKVKAIEARNRRVERDKQWEQSLTRTVFLLSLTYLTTTIVFILIAVPSPYLNAIIPTVGYLISTQSLPFIKRYWLRHNGPP